MPTVTPAPTATPTAEPTPTGGVEPTEDPGSEEPLIVGKVDDNGTPGDSSDDTLLPGATFALYLDDGDGVFEPEGDDAPRLDAISSDNGFHVFRPSAPGSYWVVEVEAPPGFDTEAPRLVDYLVAHTFDNCVVFDDQEVCVPDDDPDGGYVLVAVGDSPTGGVAPLTPPPTDVAVSPAGAPVDGLTLTLAGLGAVGALSLVLASSRRSRFRR